MKLTNDVISLLKSFSEFNTNIKFVAGDSATGKTEIRACNPSKSFLARTQVDVVIPQSFCIYDLKEFLNTIALFDDPEFEFKDTYAVIKDAKKRSCSYFFAEPRLVEEYVPDYTKSLDMPYDFSFEIEDEDLTRVLRAASIMTLETIAIRPNGKGLEVVALDEGDDSANTYGVEVADVADQERKAVLLSREDIHVIRGNYEVDINDIATHFTHSEKELEYWIVNQATKG